MIRMDGLIATVAIGLAIALFGGLVATRLRLPVLVGYLLAGVAVGPFTPGFVANVDVAHELAELGVILLMFGVGIHFSLRDLFEVRSIAVPGAVGQIAVATTVGAITSVAAWGWSLGAGLVLGLAISVASTVVLLRALAERGMLDTVHGRVAVGWLIVEDIFTVLVLALLPALAPALGGAPAGGPVHMGGAGEHPLVALALALVRVAVFGALMLFVGARVIPRLLNQVARTGSRELFTLAVLALALGVAFAASFGFGVSLALGAFLAGVVVSGSDLSHQAAANALPLRDAFAVLFFVSVGMLFDPVFLLAAPFKVLVLLGVIVLGKGLAALLIVAALGHPLRTGLTVAAGLAQVGEFSFILAELGRELDLLPEEGHSLILASAIISITLNPLLFGLIDPLEAWIRRRPRLAALLQRRGGALAQPPAGVGRGDLRGHAVLCGYGRVGRLIAQTLDRRGLRYVVIDQDRRHVEELHRRGVVALYGDAANPVLLQHAGIDRARVLVIAISDPHATRHIVEHARQVNPRVGIVARTHGETEWAYLREHGVDEVVLGERELAVEMCRYTLHRFGVSGAELQAMVQGLRQRDERPAGPNDLDSLKGPLDRQ
jgi:CPA2 family monovalent cation:H+ antiporter-2